MLPGSHGGLTPQNGRWPYRNAAMLAAMTSLAVLAQNTGAAPPAFNGLFYATIATIIPVFFLALAVQIPTFVRVFRAYQGLGHAPPSEQRTRWQAFLSVVAMIVAALMQIVLGAGVIAAGWGEMLAVYALHQEQDQASTQQIVFGSVALLIVGATGLPVLNYLGGLSRTRTPAAADSGKKPTGQASPDSEDTQSGSAAGLA